MCDNLTYRSAGAETLVQMNTINILLRWSKEGVLGYVGTAFVQLNSPDEPISYIRTHVYISKERVLRLLHFFTRRSNCQSQNEMLSFTNGIKSNLDILKFLVHNLYTSA